MIFVDDCYMISVLKIVIRYSVLKYFVVWYADFADSLRFKNDFCIEDCYKIFRVEILCSMVRRFRG